jgi:steroid delta-isomerase-like uncharacterized protein
MNAIERQRQKVNEHVDLENAHNWAAVVDTFDAGSPAFTLMPAAATLSGKAGIASAYQILSTALPDVQVQVIGGFDVPGTSVREVVITGTHRGEYFGIPASGRRVNIEIACFFEFDSESRLVVERVYFDNARLFAQMRGELQV